jgi:hypothetical protein
MFYLKKKRRKGMKEGEERKEGRKKERKERARKVNETVENGCTKPLCWHGSIVLNWAPPGHLQGTAPLVYQKPSDS